MTDLLLALPLALLSFSRDYDFDDWDNGNKIVTSSSALEIASDSSFATKTHEFSAGQTIYVRVTSDVSGSTKRELNLRDNSYKLITTYQLSPIGSNQYTASFSAPNNAGIYSLEARLESTGSVVNLVQTIGVEGSGSSSNSNVSVNINNQVNTGDVNDDGEDKILGEESEEVSPSAQATPAAELEVKDNFWVSIWKEIIEFFRGMF